MKKLKNVGRCLLVLFLIGSITGFKPLHAQKTFKIKLVKRAKVNKYVYQNLSASIHGQGLRMLGNMTIAPKKGFLLFQVNGGNAFLNLSTDDEPSAWAGEKEISVTQSNFKLEFSDGGYLWSRCICPQVNDGCKLETGEASNGGLTFTCTGMECCTQKWGYIDPDGKGTVFN